MFLIYLPCIYKISLLFIKLQSIYGNPFPHCINQMVVLAKYLVTRVAKYHHKNIFKNKSLVISVAQHCMV